MRGLLRRIVGLPDGMSLGAIFDQSGYIRAAVASLEHEAGSAAILASLVANYTPAEGESDALLLHGVYDLPKNNGVDEGNLWGDYFYLEALVRREDPSWQPPWRAAFSAR